MLGTSIPHYNNFCLRNVLVIKNATVGAKKDVLRTLESKINVI